MSAELPASPCVRDCCLDSHDTCLGCYRTLDEIMIWHAADATERQQILDRCAQRRMARETARPAPRG